MDRRVDDPASRHTPCRPGRSQTGSEAPDRPRSRCAGSAARISRCVPSLARCLREAAWHPSGCLLPGRGLELFAEGVEIALKIGPAPTDPDSARTAPIEVQALQEGFGDSQVGGGRRARRTAEMVPDGQAFIEFGDLLQDRAEQLRDVGG
ncbi:MAG: hypothetical protein MZV64_10090 [Ignavibacteriales bacterium]|nr:hypothetical protein [Ignavibacteriales bacterium]